MIEVATGRTLETKGNRNESVGGWRLTTPCMKLLNVECGKNLEMNNHRSSINRPQPLLQDCSTSHPTSANHLRGRANPHLSCKNYPSGLITEASDHPSPANQRYHRHHSTFVFSSPFAALRGRRLQIGNFCFRRYRLMSPPISGAALVRRSLCTVSALPGAGFHPIFPPRHPCFSLTHYSKDRPQQG